MVLVIITMIDHKIIYPAHIAIGIVLAGLGGAIFTGTLDKGSLALRAVRGTAIALAIIVATTQGYFLATSADTYARAVNVAHIAIVAPLLFTLGYLGHATPRCVSGAVVMLGGAAAVYHAVRTAQYYGALARVQKTS